jgi:hypothetical protein
MRSDGGSIEKGADVLRASRDGMASWTSCSHVLRDPAPVQITRFGGPDVMDMVDLPDRVSGDGQKLYDVCSAGVNFAGTHQRPSCD